MSLAGSDGFFCIVGCHRRRLGSVRFGYCRAGGIERGPGGRLVMGFHTIRYAVELAAILLLVALGYFVSGASSSRMRTGRNSSQSIAGMEPSAELLRPMKSAAVVRSTRTEIPIRTLFFNQVSRLEKQK